jgi:hypothetical protein
MFIAVLKISNKPVPVVLEKVDDVVDHMTGNVVYTTPSPTLASITTENGKLRSYYQKALNGDRAYKGLMRSQLLIVLGQMSLLTGYVQVTSGGDEEKIQSAGFLTKKAPVPAGPLPAPGNVRVVPGNAPGELKVMWAGVPNRKEYRLQMSLDPPTNESWDDVEHAFTGKVRRVVEGLEPGKIYWFRVFAIGTAGQSGPSDVAQCRVP